jgi:hypothetical protein
VRKASAEDAAPRLPALLPEAPLPPSAPKPPVPAAPPSPKALRPIEQ